VNTRAWCLAASVAACNAPTGPAHTAAWTLAGAVNGPHTADDHAGGTATCSVAIDPDDVVTGTPFFTLVLVEPGGASVRLVVHGWSGPGTYRLGGATPGVAVASERAELGECERGSSRCYVTTSGCAVAVATWVTDEPATGAAGAGVASGQLECSDVENSAGRVLTLSGTFKCRAWDFSR
jgi:hypothetical protein